MGSRLPTGVRLALGLAALACLWPGPLAALNSGRSFTLLVGSSVARFDAPPIVTVHGQRFVSFAVVAQLRPGPAPGGSPAQPPLPGTAPLGGRPAPSGTQRNSGSRQSSTGLAGGPPLAVGISFHTPLDSGLEAAAADATDVGGLPESHYDTLEGAPAMPSDEEQDNPENLLTAPAAGSVGPPRAGRQRFVLGAHTLDLAALGQPLDAELNGQPVAAANLFELGGQRYLAASLLERLGLVLYYNSLEGAYALAGLVYRVEYAPEQHALSLSCLTPVRVNGVQDDPLSAHFEVAGGFFASPQPTDLSGDPFIKRMGFKSQPQLGRSFLYLRQPRQTGFKTASDNAYGFARIDFGNYFQIASHELTSSGEISLNIQLGAPAQPSVQLLASPPRLVLDFPGVQYAAATQYIPVNRGAAREIRIGTPQDGSVRVVVELTQRVDYRVLSRDHGARYFVQLLPPAGTARIAGRGGRTVMLDPGHGGTDEGTPGILPGSQEKVATLQIVRLLKARLEALGYTVLLTRRDDRFVSLGARTDYANAALPYVFVSIHCNSITNPEMTGAMTFRHDKAGPEAIRLAGNVQRAVVAATGCVDKGVRSADFFVLRESVMPAVLVETGFMTNRGECAKLLDPAYQAKLAQGVAQGIDSYVAGGS